ncbi:inositol oxygenase-like isoform X2 [Bolinopsis microptera]|uniref:inositol oxygenase-like isoform X2 n=1 Tax=Bolinopsis microptera TaxID=2820187 RepID=UPI003079B631
MVIFPIHQIGLLDPDFTTMGLEDPSEIYRPEPPQFELDKAMENFRDYENLEGEMIRVRDTYYDMHKNQTHQFACDQREKYRSGIMGKHTIMEMMDVVAKLVDESDPDTSLPNDIHMYQTAERIREAHPDQPWFALVGLIHDLGKVLALHGEPQWAVVGDVFVTGCQPGSSVVFGLPSFKGNPDIADPRYNTKYGIYSPNCGLNEVVTSWGHDEYMYQVLTRNKATIPTEGLYMIRYHSLYPWHHHEDYHHLCSDIDMTMLPWVQKFSSFDLYSKGAEIPDVEAVKPFYEDLIDKYCPGKLLW